MWGLLPLLCTWLTFSAVRSYSHVYCGPSAHEKEIFRNGILRAPRWLISACCEKYLGIIEDSWIPVVLANFRHDITFECYKMMKSHIEERRCMPLSTVHKASIVFLYQALTHSSGLKYHYKDALSDIWCKYTPRFSFPCTPKKIQLLMYLLWQNDLWCT